MTREVQASRLFLRPKVKLAQKQRSRHSLVRLARLLVGALPKRRKVSVFAQTEARSKRCRLTWRWCGRAASVESHRLSVLARRTAPR